MWRLSMQAQLQGDLVRQVRTIAGAGWDELSDRAGFAAATSLQEERARQFRFVLDGELIAATRLPASTRSRLSRELGLLRYWRSSVGVGSIIQAVLWNLFIATLQQY